MANKKIKDEILVSDGTGTTVLYHPSGFSMSAGNPASVELKKSSPIIKDVQELQGVSPWGTDNLFPNHLVTDIEKSDIIPDVLDRKARMLYSGGIVYGKEIIDNGKKVFVPIVDAEIEDFLEASNIDLYAEEAALDFYTFYNVFARLHYDISRKKIARLSCHDAFQCRLGLQNKSTGHHDMCYINANWEDGPDAKSPSTISLPAVDSYYNVVGQLMNGNKHDYIMPLRTQGRGRMAYNLAPWNGLRTIGWLDVAFAIPQFKKFLMGNQMTFKYHISVDPTYWIYKYKATEWNKMTSEQQLEKKKELISEVVKASQGNENAGAAFLSDMIWNDVKGAHRELIKIQPLNNTLKGGEYNEDSREADYHIVRALGFPPALHGITPSNNGNGGGSGSDIREARNSYMLETKPHATRILSPLKAISQINGWNKRLASGNNETGHLVWTFQNYFVATLDAGKQLQPANQ